MSCLGVERLVHSCLVYRKDSAAHDIALKSLAFASVVRRQLEGQYQYQYQVPGSRALV